MSKLCTEGSVSAYVCIVASCCNWKKEEINNVPIFKGFTCFPNKKLMAKMPHIPLIILGSELKLVISSQVQYWNLYSKFQKCFIADVNWSLQVIITIYYFYVVTLAKLSELMWSWIYFKDMTAYENSAEAACLRILHHKWPKINDFRVKGFHLNIHPVHH